MKLNENICNIYMTKGMLIYIHNLSTLKKNYRNPAEKWAQDTKDNLHINNTVLRTIKKNQRTIY